MVVGKVGQLRLMLLHNLLNTFANRSTQITHSHFFLPPKLPFFVGPADAAGPFDHQASSAVHVNWQVASGDLRP